MSDDQSNISRSPQRNPGQLAFSVMGWVELTVSVITFILGVQIAAVTFGVAAIFMTLIATAVKRRRYDLPGDRRDQPAARQPSGPAFWVQLGLAAALIVAAVIFLIVGNLPFAVMFIIWGLTFGLFTHRAAVGAADSG